MDPDRTLDLARECARDLRRAFGSDDDGSALDAADGLLTAFVALDSWITRGGSAPRDWRLSQMM